VPCLTFVPCFVPILVYSLNDDSEDEIPPLPTHLPQYESIQHEPTLVPPLLIWFHSRREVFSDIVSDIGDQH
jgi:hypothetical protein